MEIVITLEYLGTIINNDGKMVAEIANRSKKISYIYYAMNNTILKKREIDRTVKMIEQNIITILGILCASENLVLQKKTNKKAKRNGNETF